jgi:hypothetical protein
VTRELTLNPGGSSASGEKRLDGMRTSTASGCTSAGRGGTANSSVSMNLEKPATQMQTVKPSGDSKHIADHMSASSFMEGSLVVE